MMSSYVYEALSIKDSFNATVRQIKSTVAMAEKLSEHVNLADAINELIDEKAIKADDALPVAAMLLPGKFGYRSKALNLNTVATDLALPFETVKDWHAFDFVVLYHHPDLGVLSINPKNPDHISRLDRLNRYELMVVMAGAFGQNFDATLADKACMAILSLFQGVAIKEDSAFRQGACAYKPARQPKPAPSIAAGKRLPKPVRTKGSGQVVPEPAVASSQAVPVQPVSGKEVPRVIKPGSRMTPMYAVRVANELFHNGNVEAWKRIIESYKAKHPELEVLVYYDGERITNLNALFKWGKVKHGSVIQFAVVGETIADVAKLQRYLSQGASSMFEAFLRGPVNGVLPLF